MPYCVNDHRCLHLVGDEKTAGIPRRARDRLHVLRGRSPDAVAREAAVEVGRGEAEAVLVQPLDRRGHVHPAA